MKNVLFALTLLSSAVAFAGTAEQFAQLDADKSGTLSAEEAAKDAAVSEESFKTLDANADGQLSQEEFTAAAKDAASTQPAESPAEAPATETK